MRKRKVTRNSEHIYIHKKNQNSLMMFAMISNGIKYDWDISNLILFLTPLNRTKNDYNSVEISSFSFKKYEEKSEE